MATNVLDEIKQLQESAALNKRLAQSHRRAAQKDSKKLHELIRFCAAAGITIESGIDQGVIADAIASTTQGPSRT